MIKISESKSASLIICLLVYVLAFILARYTALYFRHDYNLLIIALIADVAATVVVFIFSVLFNNSSLYDPYWSVAPPVIITYWIIEIQSEISLTGWLLLVVTVLWSLRLTINWIRGWRGLTHEDWRYIQLKNQHPALYPFTNFAGIHLFPTLIVFICLIPAYYSIVNAGSSISYLIIAATVICIAATIVSFVADEQMRGFRKKSDETSCIEIGLWKYSRHPNYFGEILFWWGIWLFAIGVDFNLYWTVFGCMALTLMFVFITIPMMEKRNLSKRKNYHNTMQRIPMLFKWF